MSPRVVGREELERRRREILDELSLTHAEFRELISTRSLTGEEWAAREELDQITFLLGESTP